jgi:hypothetical protein
MQQLTLGTRAISVRNAIGGIAIGIGLLASPATVAQAQPNGQVGRSAWCVNMGNLGGYLECNYHTHQQCMIAAWGVTNVCEANPFYVPRPQQRQRRDPRR